MEEELEYQVDQEDLLDQVHQVDREDQEDHLVQEVQAFQEDQVDLLDRVVVEEALAVCNKLQDMKEHIAGHIVLGMEVVLGLLEVAVVVNNI